MPYVATYSADFTKWNTALKDATAGLKAFEVPVKGVQRQLENMAKSFSGVEIRKQADLAVAAVKSIGGASKLTEQEQKKVNATVTEAIAKYKALGQQAPAELKKLAAETAKVEKQTGLMSSSIAKVGATLAGAFTVGAIVNLSRQVLKLGSDLQDLSAQTGIGVEALQEFKFAGGLAGVSIDAITTAVNQMQNRIAEGDKSAVGALKRLNVSLEDFKKLKPEDQFQEIANKVSEIADPAERVRTAMDLMGKTGAQVLPALTKGFAEAREEARRLKIVLDEETVRALDTMGERIEALQTVYLAAFARALIELEPLLKSIGSATIGASTALDFMQDQFEFMLVGIGKTTQELAELEVGFYKFAESVNPAARMMGTFTDAIADAERRAEDARQWVKAMADGIERDATRAIIALAKLGEVRTAPQAAIGGSKVGSLSEELNAARKALSLLTSEQRRNIQAGLELHQSHEDIAEAVKTSATVVKLYDDNLQKASQQEKKSTTSAKALAAAVKAGLLDVAKFHREAAIENAKIYEAEADKSMSVIADTIKRRIAVEEEADREIRRLTSTRLEFMLQEEVNAAEQAKRIAGTWTDGWEEEFENIEQIHGAKMLAMVRDTDEYRLAMIALGTVFPPLLEYLDELEQKSGEAGKAGKKFGEVFRKNLEQSVGNISDIIVNSLVHGASFEDTAAAVGAEIGSGIGAAVGFAIGGPLGAAIGDAIGSLLGPLLEKIIKTRAEKTVERIGRELGIAVTEEFAQGIEDTAKNIFGGNRQAARIFSLEGLIDQAGGLNADNFRPLIKEFRDLFSMLQTGAFTSAQAVQVLDQNFRTFADFVTKGGSLASKELLEIIRLTEANGLKSAEVSAFVVQETDRAMSGLTTFLNNAAVKTQAAADGISAALFGIFEAQTANGVPAAEVIKQLDPLIAKLDAQLKAAGLSGGAAFDQIKSFAAVASHEIAGPLITGILGLEQAMAGLHNSGVLNEEMFDGLTASVADTFAQILATGVDGSKALQLIAPSLQTIWELSQDFGYTVDENTQKLLEEAEAAGIVGDEHRTAQEQMLIATNKMAEGIDRLVELFEDLTGATEDFGDAINDLPEIPSPRDIPEFGGGDYGGSRDYDQYYAAKGGMVPKYLAGGGPSGTDTVPAWLSPGEFVMNRSAVNRIGANNLQAMNSGASASGDMVVNLNVTVGAGASRRQGEDFGAGFKAAIKGGGTRADLREFVIQTARDAGFRR